MKVQVESFHLNGHIIGFRPQTQKLESPYKTPSNTLVVKGLICRKATKFVLYTRGFAPGACSSLILHVSVHTRERFQVRSISPGSFLPNI